MVKYENLCVNCGLPCLHDSCPQRNVPVRYCDRCESGDVMYQIDGEDFCEKCASDEIKKIIEDMTLREKAIACGVHLVEWR